MQSSGVNISSVPAIDEYMVHSICIKNIFQGLETEYLQTKYFKEKFLDHLKVRDNCLMLNT
jgi:hypothetical protein